MKRLPFLLILLALLLISCSAASEPLDTAVQLSVTNGSTEKAYSLADLQALPATEAVLNEITYKGVLLTTLLDDAQFTPADLNAVKAVASDGFSANYDPAIFMREDVIVAYAVADGELAAEDGQFRMVLPGEGGKLNVRMLASIQAIP